MLRNLRALLAAATGAAAAGSLCYAAIALARTRAFARRPKAHVQFAPPLTVLKPLHGSEPGLYENLCSFCNQDYPAFQVIFGVEEPDDEAVPVARAVMQRFPAADLRLVVTGGTTSIANPKVANLAGMLPYAKYELLVIADSDVAAGPRCLQTIAACFSDPSVGAATCLYGALPTADLSSTLGAMQVNEQFIPSVLVALAIEPLAFCLGATMAVRRDVLEHIGGFSAIGGHIADDYLLGKLVARAGFRVELCDEIVHTAIAEADIRALWAHELRWARTIRRARPGGYAGSLFTFALPVSACYALCALNRSTGIAAVAAAAALRMLLHNETSAVFAPDLPRRPWLIPLRDALGIAIWVAGFFGDSAAWRGENLRLGERGEITEHRSARSLNRTSRDLV